jgi:glutamine synthetase
MGVEPLIYDDKNNVIISENNWHKTTRIEHRLGASSEHYNPYLNVIFALLNVIDAIDDRENNQQVQSEEHKQLPSSLHDQQHNVGAITLFANNDWFSRSIDKALSATNYQGENNTQSSTGQLFKDNYLKQFQRPSIIF